MMTKADRITLIVTTAVCLLPLALSAVVYMKLPDQVPFHWNVYGQPDSWIPKQFTWTLPVGMALMNGIIQLALFHDPQKGGVSRVFTRIILWMIPIMTMILYPITIFYALGVKVPILLAALLMAGMIILMFGNYLPKTKRNYTVGIKLPWTLDNEENWNKTHRLAGWLWTGGGLLLIAAAFTMQSIPVVMFSAILAIMLLITIIPIMYSYMLHRKQKI